VDETTPRKPPGRTSETGNTIAPPRSGTGTWPRSWTRTPVPVVAAAAMSAGAASNVVADATYDASLDPGAAAVPAVTITGPYQRLCRCVKSAYVYRVPGVSRRSTADVPSVGTATPCDRWAAGTPPSVRRNENRLPAAAVQNSDTLVGPMAVVCRSRAPSSTPYVTSRPLVASGRTTTSGRDDRPTYRTPRNVKLARRAW
jgi:hypothetical protein